MDPERHVELSEPEQEMLRYAELLTLNPSEVSKEDVDKLREVGFDDRAILDIAQITAYFNFVNRLAEGLGVELE